VSLKRSRGPEAAERALAPDGEREKLKLYLS